MKKVLITGMAGLIGGVLREHLEHLGGYELSALDIRPVDGVEFLEADWKSILKESNDQQIEQELTRMLEMPE